MFLEIFVDICKAIYRDAGLLLLLRVVSPSYYSTLMIKLSMAKRSILCTLLLCTLLIFYGDAGGTVATSNHHNRAAGRSVYIEFSSD